MLREREQYPLVASDVILFLCLLSAALGGWSFFAGSSIANTTLCGPVAPLDLICCNVKPLNFSQSPSNCNNVMLVRPQPQNSDTTPLPDEVCVIDWYSYNPLPTGVITAAEYINVFRMAPFTVGVVVSLGTFLFYVVPYLFTHRCRNPDSGDARHRLTWVEYCFIPTVLVLEMAASGLVLMCAYAQRVIARGLEDTMCHNSQLCQAELDAILSNNTCHVHVLTILSILEPVITFSMAILWLMLQIRERQRPPRPPRRNNNNNLNNNSDNRLPVVSDEAFMIDNPSRRPSIELKQLDSGIPYDPMLNASNPQFSSSSASFPDEEEKRRRSSPLPNMRPLPLLRDASLERLNFEEGDSSEGGGGGGRKTNMSLPGTSSSGDILTTSLVTSLLDPPTPRSSISTHRNS